MSSDRELRRWLDDNLNRGCSPVDLMNSMVAAGHQADAARVALAEALRFKQSGVVAPPGVPIARVVANPALPAASLTVPEPLVTPLASGASAIITPDRTVKVLMSLSKPRILLLGGVLSDEECDAIVEASRPKMERSLTVDRNSGGSELHASRTSEGTYFFHDESDVLTRVNRRLEALTSWPLENGEPLQILHYGVGAEYDAHYDYFEPEAAGTHVHTAAGGQRVGTLILYLNTPDAGGATRFPDVGLEVAAIKGNAVFFSYDTPSPASKTLHAGTPVTQGDKWIATRWMRERPYRR